MIIKIKVKYSEKNCASLTLCFVMLSRTIGNSFLSILGVVQFELRSVVGGC